MARITIVFGRFGGAALLLCLLAGCGAMPHAASNSSGHLLIVGGGLDDDLRFVYERFVKLSSTGSHPRIVLALTATEEGYDEASETAGKLQALRVWAPHIPVDVIRRETSKEETVAAIDRATGVLFTGGDQSRITARYRPNGRETPEWLALRRLLSRGGVIAGCSAGDMMMGGFMALRGDNSLAIGGSKDEGRGAVAPLHTGNGMAFLPWAITESHFFERERVARLVATLERTGRRLGIGVGENAAVEIDLARGEVMGLSESDSLLVDVSQLRHDGTSWCGARARVIGRGDRLSLKKRLKENLPAPPVKPATEVHTLKVASPSQNRQLALWRLFKCASVPGSGVWEVYFNEGWRITAWPDNNGEVIFDLSPAKAPRAPNLRNIES
jgi:cyanophycinase